MSLSPQDIEMLRRMMRDEASAVLKPTNERVAKVSGSYRELAPVARGARDSAHDLEDRQEGFERFATNALGNIGRMVVEHDAILKSLPPAVANAERAAQLTEGKATALIKNSDDADALRQKNSKKLTGSIVLQVLGFATAVASLLEHLLR